MNQTSARFALGIALPAVTIAAIVGPYLAFRSELPDRVATHFDLSGTPDSSMKPGLFVLTTLTLAGLGIALCIWRARSRAEAPMPLAALGGFLAGLGVGIAVGTMVSQRGLTDWRFATGAWSVIAAAVFLGLGMGALAAWLAAALDTETAPADAAATPPRLPLADGEHAVWTESVHSRSLQVIAVATSATLLVIAAAFAWWMVVPAALAAMAMFSLSTLRVRADRTGLDVRYGFLPWPRTHIDIQDIEQATVIDVRPMQWGGWGYRGSLRLMNQAAIVLRAGPGIRLDLRDGRVFVVTVDHAEIGAALLNTEIDRRAASVRGASGSGPSLA